MKEAFANLVDLNRHIGKECAWCRAQTVESFCKYLLEEAQEVEKAVQENDLDEFKEELGDLMWNVIFMTRIAESQGLFTMEEMLEASHKKLHGRHPHVFKEKTDDIARIWELYNQVKAEEKKAKEGRPKRLINGK